MGKNGELMFNNEVEQLLKKELLSTHDTFLKFFTSLDKESKRIIYSQEISSGFEAMMCDSVLVLSILELFKHNLCVSETSRDAFIHRNTLVYRLDKIKKLTGLDIKKFEDAYRCKTLMDIYFEGNKLGF